MTGRLPTLAFLAAQGASILGSAISAIALPWLLLHMDVRADDLGRRFALVSLAGTLGACAASPLMTLATERQLCIGSDIAAGLVMAALGAAFWAHVLPVDLAVGGLALVAAIGHLSNAASAALVRDLAIDGAVPAQRINGFIGTLHNAGDLAGPALGGLVVAGAGIAASLILDAATFVVAALVVLVFVRVRVQPRGVRQAAAVVAEPLRRQFIGGLSAIAGDPILRCITLLSAVVNLVVTALLGYVLPLAIRSGGGRAVELGTTLSCFGAGALGAALLYTWCGHRAAALDLLVWPAGVLTLAIAAMAFAPMAALPVAFFIVGLCIGHLGPLEQTLVLARAPRATQARILLAYSTLRTAFVPLGFLIAAAAVSPGRERLGATALAALLLLPCAVLAWQRMRHAALWAMPIPDVMNR